MLKGNLKLFSYSLAVVGIQYTSRQTSSLFVSSPMDCIFLVGVTITWLVLGITHHCGIAGYSWL